MAALNARHSPGLVNDEEPEGSPQPSHSIGKLRRRGLLSLLVGGAALLLTPPALAKRKRRSSSSKVSKIKRGTKGTTLTLKLDHAPFPADAPKYHDPTVLVFVPKYFRVPRNKRVDAIVHFHGHQTTAAQAIRSHQLREQLVESKQNGILIVPQGPVRAVDSSAGQLEKRRGLAKMLKELLRVMRSKRASEALGKASLAGSKRIGHLCLSAHSGGYKAAAMCLARGGINVHEVYLFDALYGEVDTYRRWLLKTKGQRGRERHKLISHYAGGAVRKNNLTLLRKLKQAGVKCTHESKPGAISRADMVRGAAIFVASPLAHGKVTVSHNGLRDCLFASGMKRHLKSKWFKNKNAPRKIDRRAS